jgi:hypothetical protein
MAKDLKDYIKAKKAMNKDVSSDDTGTDPNQSGDLSRVTKDKDKPVKPTKGMDMSMDDDTTDDTGIDPNDSGDLKRLIDSHRASRQDGLMIMINMKRGKKGG